jgi:acyl-CoA thioesterase-1
MSKPQINQLSLISRISRQQCFIKFCYFTIGLFFLSCVEGKKENSTTKGATEKVAESNHDKEEKSKTILCFGDSITAGYGLDDENDAFPAVLQRKIDSIGLDYNVVNSGLSGETTAGGKSRIDWVLNQQVDIFLLELGANDGLRGVDLSETESNLQSIITTVQDKSPDTKIILAGMQLPPNMGQDYTAQFQQLFENLAEKHSLDFIPFILKDVGGIEELNQSDGIHPTKEGHQIVAKNVWEVLEPLLENK